MKHFFPPRPHCEELFSLIAICSRRECGSKNRTGKARSGVWASVGTRSSLIFAERCPMQLPARSAELPCLGSLKSLDLRRSVRDGSHAMAGIHSVLRVPGSCCEATGIVTICGAERRLSAFIKDQMKSANRRRMDRNPDSWIAFSTTGTAVGCRKPAICADLEICELLGALGNGAGRGSGSLFTQEVFAVFPTFLAGSSWNLTSAFVSDYPSDASNVNNCFELCNFRALRLPAPRTSIQQSMKGGLLPWRSS